MSIETTRASLRWVLDNGKGRHSEEAYKDAWLLGIGDEDSKSDGMSSSGDSSAGGGSLDNENGADRSTCY